MLSSFEKRINQNTIYCKGIAIRQPDVFYANKLKRKSTEYEQQQEEKRFG